MFIAMSMIYCSRSSMSQSASFFQLNLQRYLTDFVFYRAKLWMILRPRNNRKSVRSSAIRHSLVHVS